MNDSPFVPAFGNPDDPTWKVGTSPAGVEEAGTAIPRRLPDTIGRYRILRLLGEGGMGAVYEAEQEQPRRLVALKVIKPGLFNPELLRRFERETQVLGRLQNAGIAQIYEAGTANTGFGVQPYFAMEFINGQSLRNYTEREHLNTRQRLELFVKVCDAVEHAHQRGIIHRDLKPGNILVDETGQPKVLDFGVARVTDDEQATRQTDLGQLVGTMAYMSPEQAVGDPLEVDTRSDVYALGVILYELLAGRLPYTISPRLHEAVRTIREQDPATLSSVNRTYGGDIETIVAKALEKDKGRRYGSAAALAEDIRRYLEDEPISARPPSATYKVSKFTRRHKALVASTASVFVVLLGGIVATTWQAVRASRSSHAALQAEQQAHAERDRAAAAEETASTERDRAVASETRATEERNRAVSEKERADNEAATAKAVNDFLQNDLLAQASANTQAGPNTKPDPDLKVRTALDRAAEHITGKFDKQPLVEASIRDTIGETYISLGLYPEARKQLQRALALNRRVLGEGDPKTLDALSRLGNTAYVQGNYAEAEALYRQALEAERRVLGPEHRDTLYSITRLGILAYVQGKYVEAEALLRQALEGERRVLGPEDRGTLSSMNNLANVEFGQGKYPQAEALHAQILEIRRRVLGPEHPDTLDSMNNLGDMYYAEGKYAQAEALLGQSLEITRRVLGPEHPDTLTSINNLGNVFYSEGKYAQAEELYRETLEKRRPLLGPEHPGTLASMFNLALSYTALGKYALAEQLETQAMEIRRKVLGPEHHDTLGSMGGLANLLYLEGKNAEAETLFSQTLEIQKRVLGPEHPDTLATLSDFGSMYERQGKFALAETHIALALAGRRHALGSEHTDTMESAADLALAYLSQAKFTESQVLAREVVETDRKLRPDDWQRFRAASLLGASLAGQKKYAEAEPLLLEGYQGMVARKDVISVSDRYHMDRAREWMVQLYQQWGKPEQAAKWQQTPHS